MRIEFWRTLEPQRGGHIMLLPQIDVFPSSVYDKGQLIVHVGWLAWKVGFFGATKMQRELKRAAKARQAAYVIKAQDDLQDQDDFFSTDDSPEYDFPPDCADGRCLKCHLCYSNYVEAKWAGELDD